MKHPVEISRRNVIPGSTIIELLVASLIVYLCYILFLMTFVKLTKPQFGSLKLKYYYESIAVIDSLKIQREFPSAVALSDSKILNIDISASDVNTERIIVHGYVLNNKDTIVSVYRSAYANEK